MITFINVVFLIRLKKFKKTEENNMKMFGCVTALVLTSVGLVLSVLLLRVVAY